MTDNVHQLQAAAEGVDIVGGALKVTFMGDEYRIAPKVGLMPLMRFAQSSKEGKDSDDMEGLAALYTLIRDCIDPSEWDRFQNDAIVKKAEADDLMKVVGDAIAQLTARPTQRPADSSAGPQTTSDNSRSTPSLSALPGGREPDPRWAGMQPIGGLARSTG